MSTSIDSLMISVSLEEDPKFKDLLNLLEKTVQENGDVIIKFDTKEITDDIANLREDLEKIYIKYGNVTETLSQFTKALKKFKEKLDESDKNYEEVIKQITNLIDEIKENNAGLGEFIGAFNGFTEMFQETYGTMDSNIKDIKTSVKTVIEKLVEITDKLTGMNDFIQEKTDYFVELIDEADSMNSVRTDEIKENSEKIIEMLSSIDLTEKVIPDIERAVDHFLNVMKDEINKSKEVLQHITSSQAMKDLGAIRSDIDTATSILKRSASEIIDETNGLTSEISELNARLPGTMDLDKMFKSNFEELENLVKRISVETTKESIRIVNELQTERIKLEKEKIIKSFESEKEITKEKLNVLEPKKEAKNEYLKEEITNVKEVNDFEGFSKLMERIAFTESEIIRNIQSSKKEIIESVSDIPKEIMKPGREVNEDKLNSDYKKGEE